LEIVPQAFAPAKSAWDRDAKGRSVAYVTVDATNPRRRAAL
jgi:hypothetical protein